MLPGEEGSASGAAESQIKSVVSFAAEVQVQGTMKNYYRNIAENKEILKMMSSLSTAINSMKQEIESALQLYDVYEDLWKKEREEVCCRLRCTLQMMFWQYVMVSAGYNSRSVCRFAHSMALESGLNLLVKRRQMNQESLLQFFIF